MKTFIILSLLPLSLSLHAENTQIQSFSSAKKKLEKEIYLTSQDRHTVYCDAEFDSQKNIIPPNGFESDKYQKRAKRIEWEHIVPAENFGRNFSEWRNGAAVCVTSKGKSYKGRRCAEKANEEYRYMQADMYNLYPAIGSVNASRRNYNFVMLGDVESSSFGSCKMKIVNSKAEPPEASRGIIARTYLYMDGLYTHYKMSNQQRQLMNAWNKTYPVDAWECERARRISKIQGNSNQVLEQSCREAGFN
ncbi:MULTISPECIES: endonuclease [unclassified Psychromonas]|uniref:endonuclease n=1 Tax=unclassified Psychromonas TaxID=2614957 RepID=UPI001C6914FC